MFLKKKRRKKFRMQYDVKKGLTKNRIALTVLRHLFGRLLLKYRSITTEYYKPKNTPYIIVSNHCDIFDSGIEMIALKQYVRFVASDHLLQIPIVGKALTSLGGVIVKHRERPSSELTGEIIANIKAGIPVGLHAEGGTTFNGETGFISEHTGQLVKDSGAALITYRFTGGYLKAPRWSKNPRKGPIFGKFVNEYSAEELSELTAEEITEIIRRDTYVNAFEEQKKSHHEYKGKDLAEYVERVLFVCPHCKKTGALHSKGDRLTCECGYEVAFGTDGFFHKVNKDLIFDNILDWDKWQREFWKEKLLGEKDGGLIFKESPQLLYTVDSGIRTLVSENAELSLFGDRFEITCPETQKIVIPFADAEKVQTAMKDYLAIISAEGYYDIGSAYPRSSAKYVAAWRYLTGREYI